jgi:hypothetical protein
MAASQQQNARLWHGIIVIVVCCCAQVDGRRGMHVDCLPRWDTAGRPSVRRWSRLRVYSGRILPTVTM